MGCYFTVIVGNVGSVYCGTDKAEATRIYEEYLDISRRGLGRAGGESITMFCDGEIYREAF